MSTADGAAPRLTVLELRLLYLLMSHPGQVLPPDVLVRRVWGPAGGGDRRLLRRVVHRQRLKIEPHPRSPRTIRTVSGQGYTFAGRRAAGTATPGGRLRPFETASTTGL